MHYEGAAEVEVPIDRLWDFLMDPEQVGRCIPGVQEVEAVEDGRQFRVKALVDLGPMKPVLSLTVNITKAVKPTQARMTLRGKGAGSHIGATSHIFLHEIEPQRTQLQWGFLLSVHGKIATLGNRILDQVAQRTTRQFIAALQQELS